MIITTSLYIYIIFLSFLGFLISFYLAHKKRTNESLVCPFRAKCNFVLHSRHANFFGIPVEFIGLSYYGLTALFYAYFLINPTHVSQEIAFIATALSVLAALFSLYLTGVQAFVLKQWCSWCLMSAAICLSIAVLALVGLNLDALFMLSRFYSELLVTHIAAFALAFGGAVMIDIFLFKFLRDLRVTTFEEDILHTHMQFIWAVLGIVLVTGFGLYAPHIASTQFNDQLLMVVLLLGVILLTNILLHTLILPRLILESSKRQSPTRDQALIVLKSWAFGAGAISTVSWAFAFLLGTVGIAPFAFGTLFGLYAILLGIAVLVSQFLASRGTHLCP